MFKKFVPNCFKRLKRRGFSNSSSFTLEILLFKRYIHALFEEHIDKTRRAQNCSQTSRAGASLRSEIAVQS